VLWRWSAFTLVDFRGNAIGPFTMHQLLAGRGGFGVKGVPSHSALMRINVGCSPQLTKSLIIANDAKGHSGPMCSVPVPIDVRCYSDSAIIIVRRSEVTVRTSN
jgi:hypothetical protein